MRNFKS